MLPIIYHLFFDLCGSATKCMTGKSLCEMRRCVYNSTQMLCLMASMDHSLHKMTGGLALILRSSWSGDVFLRALYTSLCVKKISCVKNRLGCRNLLWHSPFPTWWTRDFFLSLSIPFLLVARGLPCGVACLPVPMLFCWNIFHPCLRRLVLNKTHGREIPLRNAGMLYKFGREYEDERGGELSLRVPQRLGSGDDNEQRTYTLYFNSMNDSCQRIVWDVATCCGTLHSQHDEPMTSFSRSPFLFFSSRLACLVVLPIGPSRACKWIIYHLCLRRLVLNKTHDREIALWNARMRIYFDAKFQFCVLYTRQGPT